MKSRAVYSKIIDDSPLIFEIKKSYQTIYDQWIANATKDYKEYQIIPKKKAGIQTDIKNSFK